MTRSEIFWACSNTRLQRWTRWRDRSAYKESRCDCLGFGYRCDSGASWCSSHLRAKAIIDEKWKCAYELFGRAPDLPASKRLTFSQSSTSDPEVLPLALELIASTQDEDSEDGVVLKPGARFSHYEIQERLGRGGRDGEVYSARPIALPGRLPLKHRHIGNACAIAPKKEC